MIKIIKNIATSTSIIFIAVFTMSVSAGQSANLGFNCSDNGTTVTCTGSLVGARKSSESTRYALFAKIPTTLNGIQQDVLTFQANVNGRTHVCLLNPANLQNDLEAALALAPNNFFQVQMPSSNNSFSGACTSFRAYNGSLYLP